MGIILLGQTNVPEHGTWANVKDENLRAPQRF